MWSCSPVNMFSSRRWGRREAADARDGFPDHRSCQRLGLLPGTAGGIPRGALQAQRGAARLGAFLHRSGLDITRLNPHLFTDPRSAGEDQRRCGRARARGARLPEQPGPGGGHRRLCGEAEQLALRLHRQQPCRPEDCASGEEPLDPERFSPKLLIECL